MVELFQIGVLGDWVVDLDQAGLVVKMLPRSILLESNRMLLGAPDQKSLGGMIVLQIGIVRNLVKGYGKESVMRDPANDPMTGVVIQGKRGTLIETVRELGIGTENETKRETEGVTAVIEIGTRIMAGTETRIEIGNVSALMAAAGTVTEITSVQVASRTLPGTEITSVRDMNMTVVTCRKLMLNMVMVSAAITNMNITEAMSSMVIAKMDMGLRLSAQSDMIITLMIHTVKWQPFIRGNLTMQNLKARRKVRHTREELPA